MPIHNVPNKGPRALVFKTGFVYIGPNFMARGPAQIRNLLLGEGGRNRRQRTGSKHASQNRQSGHLVH